MQFDREYDWAAYKRAQRGHNAGDHSICDPNRCDYAERIWVEHDAHLRSIAMLAELDAQGLDAATFLGDDYESTVASVNAEFPDFPYLVPEPDFVHVLQARAHIKELIAGGAGQLSSPLQKLGPRLRSLATVEPHWLTLISTSRVGVLTYADPVVSVLDGVSCEGCPKTRITAGYLHSFTGSCR